MVDRLPRGKKHATSAPSSVPFNRSPFFLPPKRPKSTDPPKINPHPLGKQMTMINGCYFAADINKPHRHHQNKRPLSSTQTSSSTPPTSKLMHSSLHVPASAVPVSSGSSLQLPKPSTKSRNSGTLTSSHQTSTLHDHSTRPQALNKPGQSCSTGQHTPQGLPVHVQVVTSEPQRSILNQPMDSKPPLVSSCSNSTTDPCILRQCANDMKPLTHSGSSVTGWPTLSSSYSSLTSRQLWSSRPYPPLGNPHNKSFSEWSYPERFGTMAPLSSAAHGGFHHRAQSFPGSLQRSHPPLRPQVVMNQELQVANSFKLSVLCYNMLAQDLIASNMYLYSQRSPQHLNWEFRKINILSELSHQSADILCLQEVQEDAYLSWFLPQLSREGYSGLYKKRTGSHSDGCALFFKHSKLRLIEHKALEFQKGFRVMDRDNVGIIAKFLVKANNGSESLFGVATTHLLYNPKAGEIKLAQLSYLLAELHQMTSISKKGHSLPVILCGDFNSLPGSPLVNFVTTAKLDYSKMSATEVAGYRRHRGFERTLPKPLFPCEMGIDNSCQYREPPNVEKIVNVIDLTLTDEVPSQRVIKEPITSRRNIDESTQPAIVQSDLRSPSQSTSQHILTHPFKLNCVYPFSAYQPKSTVTTFHQSAFETVDYIFYSPVVNSRGFHLLSRKALPSTHILLQLGPQPHECLSSDHLFLLATFQLIW